MYPGGMVVTQAASAYTRTLEGAKQLPSINRKSMHNNVQERDEREIRRKGCKVGGPGTVGKWGERGCEMDFYI